jgi:two-component system sensor histidine kinase KdpD
MRWTEFGAALAITALCTLAVFPVADVFGLVNVVMVYLLGTTLAALRLGRAAVVAQSLSSMLAFDYFFVPPTFSFDVADTKYLFTLGVMLIVALVIANLMVSIRYNRDSADASERRTTVLYSMSRELAVASDSRAMAAAAVRHISDVFHSSAGVWVADDDGCLTALGSGLDTMPALSLPEDAVDMAFAAAVVARGERGIKDGIYLPLQGTDRTNGVIVVRPRPRARLLPPEQLTLLDAFAAQLALSLQRARLAQAAEAARLAADQALLRNTLLASISHDLRTPLAAIAGAGSLISQPEYALNEGRRMTLGRLIEKKARDMAQLLTNVLELMQLESGSGKLRADWYAIDELVALALRPNEVRLAQWRIVLNLPSDLPLIFVEASLIVQILGNLLENAAKYTPPGTTITLSAAPGEDRVFLRVADDGPGLPEGDPERLFDKFHRGRPESNIVGVGLGLAICRAAARLHGGNVRAEPNPGGGACFEIDLPVPVQAGDRVRAEAC